MDGKANGSRAGSDARKKRSLELNSGGNLCAEEDKPEERMENNYGER
jgi:hypothetical protein